MPDSSNLLTSDEDVRIDQPHCHTITSDVTPNPTAIPETPSDVHSTIHTLQDDLPSLSPITHRRFFLDLFAGHSAPLTVAAKAANLDHFCPFDIEFNHLCNILDDTQFENLLKLAHSGLIGAIWSAPPCKLYSQLRKNDLDGLPSLSAHQLLQVQESKEIHRRSDGLCIAVFQQGFAAQKQPINSLAWCEKSHQQSHQQFLEQCSCYFVATPACKWGLDWYKTWAIAASSDRIHTLSGQCTHDNHQDFRRKRLPDGSFISALTAEYPSKLASAIIDIIKPWASQSSSYSQDLALWKHLLAKRPIARGSRITDGAGNNSSANWTIPLSQDIFKEVRKRWISRILSNKLHTCFVHACITHQTAPFITDEDLFPFLHDLTSSFPSTHWDTSVQDFQPFRLKLFHTLLSSSKDPDADSSTFAGRNPTRSFFPSQPSWTMGT